MSRTRTKKTELSGVMAAALVAITEWGGSTVRHAGGYWTSTKTTLMVALSTGEHVGAPTIAALEARGYLEYTAWQTGKKNRFPIAAKLTEKAR